MSPIFYRKARSAPSPCPYTGDEGLYVSHYMTSTVQSVEGLAKISREKHDRRRW